MKADGNIAVLRIGVLLVAVGSIVSCASSGRFAGTQVGGAGAGQPPKKTQQEVQSELMAFADRYFAETLDLTNKLEDSLPSAESRYYLAGARLLAMIVTADIAASPNPGSAVLDMCVFVTLKRTVWEDHWMPDVYGVEAGRETLDVLSELEQDIWTIAAGVYTDDQLAQLKGLIDDWRSQHPGVVAVDFVRLTELGDARRAKTLMEAGRPGGMLAPVTEANRNLEEMRLLAERLAFMMTRLQIGVSLQVEMASAKLATQPEVRQLLEDSTTFVDASDRAAAAFAALVADLPEERRAAIDQVLAGLGAEREQLLADLGAEDGRLRPALADVRQTLEVGRELSVVLGETVRDFDVLVDRMMKGNPNSPRPFDIMDWQETITEATVTAREVQAVLTSIERILGSPATEGQLDTIVEAADRVEREVIDDVINRAFLYCVALIVIFFIALTIYRWLTRRLAPDLRSNREAEE